MNVILNADVTKIIATTIFYPNPNHPPHDARLVLDGEKMELESVFLNEQRVQNYELNEEALTLNVPIDKPFTLQITTCIKPQDNKALVGLYQSQGVYCTQCEANGFRRMTYYLDRPDVMASFTTRIEADRELYPLLLSNGNLIEEGVLDATRHFAIWHDPFKKPCYLFALVAGRLECRDDIFTTASGRAVTLKIFVEPGKVDRTAYAMDALKKAMRWDEVHYGREYDLDIFMIVAVSDFNMGAMENKGLNVFNDKYILANPNTATDADYEYIDIVVAHEYFHNWTGNRITCREWFNLCLKEGLTVFRDQCFSADITHPSVARIKRVSLLRAQQFPEDGSGLAHAVRPDSYVEINNFYTPTVYEKGAEIFHMLHTLIGSAAFRAGMDLYFEKFDGCAVTIDDLMDVMEEATQKDLSQFRLWYAQAGTPCVTVRDEYDAATSRYSLHITQSLAATPEQPDKKPMLMPITVGLLNSAGEEIKKTQVLELTQASQTFVFQHITEKPTPSLLRHFSAPVKLEYAYSDDDLHHLIKYDTDDFNHFEMGQRLSLSLILKLITKVQNNEPLNLPDKFIGTYAHALTHLDRNGYLLAQSLKLPEENYIGSFMPVYDIDALHTARTFIITTLAEALKADWMRVYDEQHSSQDYQYDVESVAKRALKNTCLYYLAHAGSVELALAHYQESDNMTDTMAALVAVNDVECAIRSDLFNAFFKTWQKDPLVLNKGLMLQATSRRIGAFEEVVRLSTSDFFDIKNPNKVYALFNSFAVSNPLHFHRSDGQAYEFYGDRILEIDAFNPQVAARLARAFSTWQQMDAGRKTHALRVMNRIVSQAHLSKDVSEVVSKLMEGQ